MPSKQFYNIGEVSELLGVNPSAIRYWESQFSTLRPLKSVKGTRLYSMDDIEKIQYVKHLKSDCGYSSDGIRQRLRTYNTDNRRQVVQTLLRLRSLLMDLKDQL